MSEEEIALRLIESDCSTDYYFKILEELENHTTKIQELEKEKAHIEIAYEEDYKEQQQEIERLKEELKYTIPIVEHNKTITKHLKEIERLKSIIKEVRENIEKYSITYEHEVEPYKVVESEVLLEILDKENMKAIPPEVIGTNGEDGCLFDYGDKGE